MIFEKVKRITDRVKMAQANVKNLFSSIQVWALQPLYERKDGKKENLICLDDRQERLTRRYDQIRACSNELVRVIEENYLLFFGERMRTLEEMAIEMVEGAAAAYALEQAAAALESAESSPKGGKKGAKKGAKKGKGKKGSEEEEAAPAPPPPPPEAEEDSGIRYFVDEKSLVRDLVWIPYVKNLDDEIKEMIMVAIDISLFLFLKEMGDVPPVTPFFELLMELHEPDIVFVPSVDIDDPVNFHSFVCDLMEDIFGMGVFMVRVDPDENESYARLAKEESDIRFKQEEIGTRIMNGMEKALAHTKLFDEYVMLWVEDRHEFLRQFLTYSRLLTLEELEQLKDENGPGIKESPPTVAQFKEQIDYYENLYKKVEQIPSEHILMEGWLRLDMKPLRQAILNTICKWGNMFKQHLFNHVIDSLNGLENFIRESIAAMQVPLTEDDYDGLLKVMGYLFKVKERQVETDSMFEPLKEIMELLKDYGVEFPEEIYVQLQEIPDRWIQCKKVKSL